MRARTDAGLALALLSAATFGTSGALATSLIHAGWTPGAAVLVRVSIAAVVLSIPAMRQLRRAHVRSMRSLRTVGTYGLVAVAGAQLCYFNAVQHLSVAVALLLEYSGILLVVGWMWLRHGHRPRRLTAAGAVAALAGLCLVLDLFGNLHVDGIGVLWALGAAVGLAAYFVISAEVRDPLPPLVIAWGGLAVGAVALAFAAVIGVLPVEASRTSVVFRGAHVSWLVPVLGLSLVAAVVAYVAGISAARLLGAKVASFVGLTEVLFAVLFAWLLLGQRLGVVQIVGAVLVVGGIALVRIDELTSSRPLQPEPLPGDLRAHNQLPARHAVDAVGRAKISAE
ncbi:MAG TPA: EamA family transporter [Mycobacteriales bacterium]|nr:EamA family transporter [Mycobacteriales bacterium]